MLVPTSKHVAFLSILFLLLASRRFVLGSCVWLQATILLSRLELVRSTNSTQTTKKSPNA